MKPKLSLKGRGLQMLAQREQSRSELRRKLLKHAQQAARDAGEAAAEETGDAPAAEPAPDATSPAEQVEAVLDWLQQHQYLSEERFVESRIHARASRFGQQRIRQELAQHGLSLSPEASQQLRETEAARASEVWQRKFGVPAADPAGRARQARFLAARGFSGEVIRRVVQGPSDD